LASNAEEKKALAEQTARIVVDRFQAALNTLRQVLISKQQSVIKNLQGEVQSEELEAIKHMSHGLKNTLKWMNEDSCEEKLQFGHHSPDAAPAATLQTALYNYLPEEVWTDQGKGLAGSRYKPLYSTACDRVSGMEDVDKMRWLSLSVAKLVFTYASLKGYPDVESLAFMDGVLAEVDRCTSSKDKAICLWSLATPQLRGMEFCSILGWAVREDDGSPSIRAAAEILAVMKSVLVNREKDGDLPQHVYRGISMPREEVKFFETMMEGGNKYRAKMPLATSWERHVAQGFMARSFGNKARGFTKVFFEIQFEKTWCAHACYVGELVQRSVSHEREILFMPYSTFSVQKVTESAGDTVMIELVAYADNREHPDDLPTSSWH